MSNLEKVYSTCGEVFSDDLDMVECLEVGDGYYAGDKREIKPSELINSWDVIAITEAMDERLYEIVGDVSSGVDMSNTDCAELLTLIKGFVDSKCEVTCYAVDNIVEKVKS